MAVLSASMEFFNGRRLGLHGNDGFHVMLNEWNMFIPDQIDVYYFV